MQKRRREERERASRKGQLPEATFTKSLNIKNPHVRRGMEFVETMLRIHENQVPERNDPFTERPKRDKNRGDI